MLFFFFSSFFFFFSPSLFWEFKKQICLAYLLEYAVDTYGLIDYVLLLILSRQQKKVILGMWSVRMIYGRARTLI